MIFGRDEAWQALDEVVLRPDRLGSLLLLRGSAGVGKSALLDGAGARWRRRGVRVVSVSAAAEHLLDQLREITRAQLAGHAEPGVPDSVASAARSATSGDDPLPLVHVVTRGLARLARRRPTALVVEDVDRAAPEWLPALSLLAQGARAVGSAVIVSSRSRATGDLHALADQVLDLPELTDDDVASLISQWSGRKAVDPTVTSGLTAALGPLAGNPGTVLSTVRALDASERLVSLDGHLCLLHPHEPIPLADEHELLLAIRCCGPAAERLAAAVAVLGGPTVDELPLIAEATGVDLNSRGVLLDQLITAGALRVGPDERLSPAVPALGAALRRGCDARVRALPSTLARHLLDRCERGDAVDREDLADRLARADPHVSGPVALDLLIEHADRFHRGDPQRAADWYRAAALRLPHSDHRRRRVLRATVRFQLRLGRYAQLADDLGAVAAARPAPGGNGWLFEAIPRGVFAEVAACWTVALLHEERSGELRAVRRLLSTTSTEDADPGQHCRGEVAGAVATLDELIARHGPPERSAGLARTIVDILGLLDAVDSDHEEFQRAWERWQARSPLPVPEPAALREAGTVVDRATLLDLLLGPGYGRPRTGPLVTYQRLVRAYHAGEWDAALSAAREMASETRTAPESPTHHVSKAFAAEMCLVRGDLQRAGEWLAEVTDDIPGGHVVSWSRAALRHLGGDTATAVREGWQDYLRHRDAGRLAGLERLLGRITSYAHRAGATARAREMLVELESLHERTRTPSGREVLLMTTGLLDGDPTPVTRSVRLARERGDLHQVLVGSQLNGELADEPEPWLRDAYGLAKQLGSPSTRAAVGNRMRELGIPLPRSRSRSAAFSDTEVRIIDLVSGGHTNRRIATAVGVSEKTVESHLTRLLARTGCRSRVELAAARLEGRLTGTSE